MLYGLFFGVIGPFVLVQARRLGATPFQVSFLAALPSIWMMLSPLWAALFGKRNPFQTVMLFDGIARLLLTSLVWRKSSNWYVFVFCLHYLFSAVSATVYGKAMRLAYPVESRGRLMGWVRVGSSAMQMISTFLAGFLLPVWGVHKVFALFAVFGVLSSLSFARIKKITDESPLEKELNKPSSLDILRADREYRRYNLSLFSVGLANLMSAPVYVLFQVDVLKISDGFVSTLAILTSLTAVVSYFFLGRFIDRYSAPYVTERIFALNLGLHLIYLWAKSPWPLLIAALLQGIINAGHDLVVLNNVIHYAKEREISSYMAVHITFLGLRGTIGPLLGSFLLPLLSFKGIFFLALIINCFGIIQWSAEGKGFSMRFTSKGKFII
ncbi:MAG TPA: MFS transporter [Firmicutes bacterium]|nr:MFS transporter [Bacillota bacterium]